VVREKRVLMPYEPFIDDPEHIRELDGQRFVVLRPAIIVSECHRQVQDVLRQRLSGLPASYPARGHVTLAGFAAGTRLESVQELVSDWIPDVPSLRIEVQGATSFPPPFQIAILKVVKTPALFSALHGLRRRAEQRGLTVSTVTPAEEWVFHMSLAYCSNLSVTEWSELARFIERLRVPSASCVQETVEIVAFDGAREYSGGMQSLSRGTSGSGSTGIAV
jgi:2'-5' RNA ligase